MSPTPHLPLKCTTATPEIFLMNASAEDRFENLNELLRDTLTRLGFVIPDVITKNEAFVGEIEKAHTIAKWRNTYSAQLKQLALSLTLSTKVKGSGIDIPLLKIGEAIERMIDLSVQKMGWLIDHRHVVGLYNDQCNYQRPLPVDIHFTSAKAGQKYIDAFTKSHFQLTADDDGALIHLQDCVYVAPTSGPQSFDFDQTTLAMRFAYDRKVQRVPAHLIRSVVAKAPSRHFGFFNPLINVDGSDRDPENVQIAFQLFDPATRRAAHLLGESQRFMTDWGL